jgi:type IV secretory pathway VirB10-like protein
MCPPADIPFLPTGFSFPALLPDSIYSYNTLAPTLAVVEDDIKFLGRVVIPKGSHLIGEATTLHTFDRVNISFRLVVFPEGCEVAMNGLALSADDGSAGIRGRVERHEDAVAAQLAMKAAITGAQAGAAIVAPVESAVSSAFTNEASSMLDQNVAKAKSLESIYIHERTQIRIFMQRRFTRDAGK